MLGFDPVLEPCCPTHCDMEFSDKFQIPAKTKTYDKAEI